MGYSRFGYCADGNNHARFVSDYCYCQKSSCFFLNRILFTANISALYQAIYFLIVLELLLSIYDSNHTDDKSTALKISSSHKFCFWNCDVLSISPYVTILYENCNNCRMVLFMVYHSVSQLS